MLKNCLLLVVFFFLNGCFTIAPLRRDIELPIPTSPKEPLTLAQVMTAVKNACADRQWKCTPKGSDEVAGVLHQRDHMMAVNMKLNKDKINYLYQDSKNLEYDGKNIHKKYAMWIEALHRSTVKYLKTHFF